jgi:lysophospholipase L1-like esterase
MNRNRTLAPAILLLASCAPLPIAGTTALPASARYVAMGSSYASGPGITQAADARDPRCSRSSDNYAHQIARSLKLDLIDVSCSGATTKHVLEGWNELAPQIDALTPDTALVTVTIGGNDLGYIGRLFAASCNGGDTSADAVQAVCAGMRARAGAAGTSLPVAPDPAAWAAVEAGLTAIAHEVHRRAPRARLIFVEYLTALPPGATCAAVPLSPTDAQAARDTYDRLARLTEVVARRSGAGVLPVAALSRGHDACAREPWVTSFVPSAPGAFVPYHPNLAGMTAVAAALAAKLR